MHVDCKDKNPFSVHANIAQTYLKSFNCVLMVHSLQLH